MEGEYRGLCWEIKHVSWESPRRGGYCFCVIWNRSDPQLGARCTHRHRNPFEAAKCARRMIRNGDIGCVRS